MTKYGYEIRNNVRWGEQIGNCGAKQNA